MITQTDTIYVVLKLKITVDTTVNFKHRIFGYGFIFGKVGFIFFKFHNYESPLKDRGTEIQLKIGEPVTAAA